MTYNVDEIKDRMLTKIDTFDYDSLIESLDKAQLLSLHQKKPLESLSKRKKAQGEVLILSATMN